MATSSFHRLISGKVEIGCLDPAVSLGIFEFVFAGNVHKVVLYIVYDNSNNQSSRKVPVCQSKAANFYSD